MAKRDLAEYSDDDLTPEERRYARMMIDRDKRMKWAMGSLYRLGIAIGALAAAITAVTTFLKKG